MAPRRAVLATVLAALAACGGGIERGIAAANDLLYRQEYVGAERLYRKLLRRTEATAAHEGDAAIARLQTLGHRLGQINALYLRNFRQAAADYEALIARAPRSEAALAALNELADLYQHRLGQLEEAIAAHQRVVQEFTGRPEARRAQLAVVRAYFAAHDYAQAHSEAAALAAAWPDTPEAAQARFSMGDALFIQRRFTEATATYEALLAERPEPGLAALVLFELGNCYEELGDGEQALGYFYAALPAHPSPDLVQHKIERLRARLHHLAPAGRILHAASSGRGGRVRVRRRPAKLPESALPAVRGPPADEESPEVPVQPPAPDDDAARAHAPSDTPQREVPVP